MSPSTLFYGIGACTVPHITETSDLFSGTGDLLNPVVMTDHLEQAYYSCLKRIEINLPVNYSAVIAKACEFAQESQINFEQNNQALSYFNLYLFGTGIIDDIDELYSQLAKVVLLPLSIYIIQIRNENIEEGDIDASKLEKKCQFLFERGNRRFLKVIPYNELGF